MRRERLPAILVYLARNAAWFVSAMGQRSLYRIFSRPGQLSVQDLKFIFGPHALCIYADR
jgi:hypothetical protein